MTALASIERGLLDLGYTSESLFRDYRFADVLGDGEGIRSVCLAAFTQLPESFRSAAFGVVDDSVDPAGAIMACRALGAPVFFSIDGDSVGVWSVGARAAPTLRERVTLAELPALFDRYRAHWHPQALHRAKALGQDAGPVQYDFVDLGLLPAIESEVEAKLHQAMADVVAILSPSNPDDLGAQRSAFRLTFRLLAAKILADRGHAIAEEWDGLGVGAVLAGIQSYYGLPVVDEGEPLPLDRAAVAWARLGQAINLGNISADSLAFVYENTLVTADTRRLFGTHSTPRAVAEYVVGALRLERFDIEQLRLVEPFTGAGIFLVAALKRLRDLLPADWSASQRHAYLVQRLSGAELDMFACEVATLSLILADYPNANGWKIKSRDLFNDGALTQTLAGATVILCNPPFEDFTPDERRDYPEAGSAAASKAAFALQRAVEAAPGALGFVLPRGFLLHHGYRQLRTKIATLYDEVELVSLPDRIFEKASYPCALLIASGRRAEEVAKVTRVVSRTVREQDCLNFLRTGEPGPERIATRSLPTSDLWISELDEVWAYLARAPRLGDHAQIHRGLRWKVQGEGVSDEPGPLRERGYFRPRDSLLAYELKCPRWLDVEPENQVWPAPLTRPWREPKILINAQRVSRGAWRLTAAADRDGMLASQQFTGIWPSGAYSVNVLEAILNGPVANAFVTEHSANQHFTNEMLKRLPLPSRIDDLALSELSQRYRDRLRAYLAQPDNTLVIELNQTLVEIDAVILQGYDLPPRLERRVLDFFSGAKRPTAHPFAGWMPPEVRTFTPLHELLGRSQSPGRGSWVLDVFKPIPSTEADAIAHFLD